MNVHTIFNVIVVLIKFGIADRLVTPVALFTEFEVYNQTKGEVSPVADQLVADAFVEEVSGKIIPLPHLEKIETPQLPPVENLNNDSSAEGTAPISKKTGTDADDKTHDKVVQVQKQYRGKKGHKSAKFGEKKGHKKGHKTKGYNNRFHKDEYHKEHKLYGDAFRDNHKNSYADVNNRHGKKMVGYGRSNKHSHSHVDNRFGKKGVDDVGKYSDNHKDFEKDSKHEQLNRHQTRRIKIKDERNPYPNHRPY